MAETPLDELQWRSPEWIQAFGLRTDNVLEYFSQSPFYDRTANNQVLKMQSQFNENFQHMNNESVQNELKKMKGIEFNIVYVREPDFWIIRKQNRLNTYQTESISDYYIVGANVYMAPIIYSILSSRLLSTSLSLKNTLTKLQEMPIFSPSQGHTYPQLDPANDGIKSKTLSTPMPQSSNLNTPSLSQYNTNSNTVNEETTADQTVSSNTLNSLLSICLKNNVTYIEDLPLSGPGSTSYDLGITENPQSSSSSLKKAPAIVRRMNKLK